MPRREDHEVHKDTWGRIPAVTMVWVG